MEFLETRLLIAVVGLAAFYIAYRMFSGIGKNERVYKESLNKVLTSDEYKVKGRFE
jgi:uncharacterized membrane protein